MPRLFVGLRPPAAIRAALRTIMGGVPGARWQEDDQLHLTLRFIGEVDRPVADDIAAALGQVHAPAPQVSLHSTGAFDKRGRTDAIWAGVTPHDALAALHQKVDRALALAGLEPERRAYLPHITLARLSRGAGVEAEVAHFLRRHAGLASAPFRFAQMILFESHLGRERAGYQMIDRWPLDLPV